MTFPAEFRMDVGALFPVRFDARDIEVPETFNPQVGDRIGLDYLRHKTGAMDDSQEVATTALFVSGVEWRVRVSQPPTNQQYELVLRVTLSSEAPSGFQSRRVHRDEMATTGDLPPRYKGGPITRKK